MQIIQNVDTSTFKLNGVKYPKNFMCIKQGTEHISIYNAFDTRFQLVSSTKYDEFTVNGVVYSNQTDLIASLATLLFSKQVVDASGISLLWSQYGSTNDIYNTDFGNVGIGVGNPSQKLEVNGGTLINGGLTANTISATSANIESITANNISGLQNYISKFTNNGTYIGDSIVYDNGNNVGVGGLISGQPDARLQVSSGNILFDNTFGFTTLDSLNSSINKVLYSSNLLSGDTGDNIYIGNNLYNQSLTFFTGGNVPNVNERFNIKGNGYIGIGTASPTKELSMVRKNGTFSAEINSYGSRSDFWLNRASGSLTCKFQ